MRSPARGPRRFAPAIILIALTAWLTYAQRQHGSAAADDADRAHEELNWEPIGEMPVGVFLAGISRVDDRVVITGGLDQAGAATSMVQVFDATTLKWSPLLQLKEGRCDHAQVTLADGRILVAGGQKGRVPGGLSPLATTEIIDINKGTVSPGPRLRDGAGMMTGHLLPDGRAVIVGGGSAWVFDSKSNQWLHNIVLRESRLEHASTLLDDGRVVVVGGTHRRSMEIVDPNRGVSRMLSAQLPESLDDLSAITLPDKRVWVLGGQSTGTSRTTDRTWIVDLSDPERTTIKDGPALGVTHGVSDASLAFVGAWVAVLGGESDMGVRDEELAEVRLLDTRTLAVWSLPNLPEPHDDAQAIAIGQDVWMFGGYRIDTPVKGLGGLGVPTADRHVLRLRLPKERTRK